MGVSYILFFGVVHYIYICYENKIKKLYEQIKIVWCCSYATWMLY